MYASFTGKDALFLALLDRHLDAQVAQVDLPVWATADLRDASAEQMARAGTDARPQRRAAPSALHYPHRRWRRHTTGTTMPSFTATLWEHDGPGGWHFLSLPHDVADDVAEASEGRTGGFGSVRVEVTIGGSRWRTSLFPDDRRGTYVLPVKKAVRTAEGLADGADATVHLLLLDRGDDGRDS